jgi:hypothetical protein
MYPITGKTNKYGRSIQSDQSEWRDLYEEL